MRILICITVIIFMVSCSETNYKNSNNDLLVKTSLIKSFDSTYEAHISRKTSIIDILLINMSDKPKTFWIIKAGQLCGY